MILLDTCTLLWLADDHSQLSVTAKKTLEENSNSIFVSAISAFEIGVKYYKKLLKLPMNPQESFEDIIREVS